MADISKKDYFLIKEMLLDGASFLDMERSTGTFDRMLVLKVRKRVTGPHTKQYELTNFGVTTVGLSDEAARFIYAKIASGEDTKGKAIGINPANGPANGNVIRDTDLRRVDTMPIQFMTQSEIPAHLVEPSQNVTVEFSDTLKPQKWTTRYMQDIWMIRESPMLSIMKLLTGSQKDYPKKKYLFRLRIKN